MKETLFITIKDIVNNSKDDGGLEVLKFTDLGDVLKIKWITELKNKGWNIPNYSM